MSCTGAEMIRWVCFDVGETIFDERGLWDRWADRIGVARQAFRNELIAVIRAGLDHRAVFERVRPGIDIAIVQAESEAAGNGLGFRPDDIFLDVRPALADQQAMGLEIGIAGNTSRATEDVVLACGLGVSFVASADRFGVEKPAPEFFETLARACNAAPAEIAYVGDRLDNDVNAANRVGMTGIWLRRGLWADVQRDRLEHAGVRTIDRLTELPLLLRNLV